MNYEVPEPLKYQASSASATILSNGAKTIKAPLDHIKKYNLNINHYISARANEFLKQVNFFPEQENKILMYNCFSYGRLYKYICSNIGKDIKVICGDNLISFETTNSVVDTNYIHIGLSGNTLLKIEEGVYTFRLSNSTIGDTVDIVMFVFLDGVNIEEFIARFSRKLIDFCKPKELDQDPMSRIFLQDDLMSDISDDVDSFLSSSNVYRKDLGLPWKRGYMFMGPPGTGKTLLIRQLCKKYDLESYDITHTIGSNGNINIASHIASERGIEDYLYPEETKPVVYIMEDIDKFATYQSGSGDHADSGSVSLHNILKALDGVDEIDGAIIMATTNYAEQIAEAVMSRPGRFDRIWKIDLPTDEQKVKMLNFHKIFVSDMTNEEIAKSLGSCNMAFVEELIKSLKKTYKRNTFTKVEVSTIVDRINNHRKNYKDHFKDSKESFGFHR